MAACEECASQRAEEAARCTDVGRCQPAQGPSRRFQGVPSSVLLPPCASASVHVPVVLHTDQERGIGIVDAPSDPAVRIGDAQVRDRLGEPGAGDEQAGSRLTGGLDTLTSIGERSEHPSISRPSAVGRERTPHGITGRRPESAVRTEEVVDRDDHLIVLESRGQLPQQLSGGGEEQAVPPAGGARRHLMNRHVPSRTPTPVGRDPAVHARESQLERGMSRSESIEVRQGWCFGGVPTGEKAQPSPATARITQADQESDPVVGVDGDRYSVQDSCSGVAEDCAGDQRRLQGGRDVVEPGRVIAGSEQTGQRPEELGTGQACGGDAHLAPSAAREQGAAGEGSGAHARTVDAASPGCHRSRCAVENSAWGRKGTGGDGRREPVPFSASAPILR